MFIFLGHAFWRNEVLGSGSDFDEGVISLVFALRFQGNRAAGVVVGASIL